MKETIIKKYAMLITIAARVCGDLLLIATGLVAFVTGLIIGEEGWADGATAVMLAAVLLLIVKTAVAYVLAIVFHEIHRGKVEEDKAEVPDNES